MQLSTVQVQAAPEDLPGWGIEDDKLYREFRFTDFVAAFSQIDGNYSAAFAHN